MIVVFIYLIAGFISIFLLLLLIYPFIIYPIRTRHIRKYPKVGQWCKFYRNEEKHSGKILAVSPASVKVKFINSIGRPLVIDVHRSRIYSAW